MNISNNRAWVAIFTACFIYWGYLLFNTKMVIFWDPVVYESTGRVLFEKGWVEFFRTEPHREPFYPALIAFSMACGKSLSVNYQFILKIFQIGFLLSAQILLIRLLRDCKINETIIKASIFYFGISPAIVNATLCMFTEIVSLPFVIAAALLSGSLWSDIKQEARFMTILWKAALFGISFGLLAVGRGVFQYVFYFILMPFCIWAVFAIFKRKPAVLRRLLIFISVAFIIFYSMISCVKAINLRYNGRYILCDAHSSIILASAYKRIQPMTPTIMASHIALIPGAAVCRHFFSQEEYEYADWTGIQRFYGNASQELNKIPPDRQDSAVIGLFFKKVMEHPWQYLFFSAVESLKMPFWETTQNGYVEYPVFLAGFFNNAVIRLGSRVTAYVVTMISFIFVTLNMWRAKYRHIHTLSFVWLMVVSYTFIYSLCYVVSRYNIPIASMYIVCIAFTINAVANRL